jgi:endoglucanase
MRAFLATLAYAAASRAAAGAVTQHGRLVVRQGAVVDQDGTPVQLRGMNLFWSQWMPQFWNAETVQWLKDDWQVTVLRAAMGVEAGGYLTHPEKEKAKLERVVKACIAADLYVIIDWHDSNADQHTTEATAFFDDMAARYGGYPNVIFEVFNEPMGQSWAGQIKPYHEAMVGVIRRHTNNLVILGTRTWSQEVDVAAADPVSGSNLAYTLHFYAATHGEFLREKARRALASGAALFVTEWGTCEASGNGALNLNEASAWLAFLDRHHISHVNWAIDDKAESCAALKPGSRQLTESGAYVQSQLRNPSSSVIVQLPPPPAAATAPSPSASPQPPPPPPPPPPPLRQSSRRPAEQCSATRTADCRSTQCCSETGMQCYEKNQYWATCQAWCTPGIDKGDKAGFRTPWSCKTLGPRTHAEAATAFMGPFRAMRKSWSFEWALGMVAVIAVAVLSLGAVEIKRRRNERERLARAEEARRQHAGAGWRGYITSGLGQFLRMPDTRVRMPQADNRSLFQALA